MKNSFVMFETPEGIDETNVEEYIVEEDRDLLNDSRIYNKWGPCGCMKIGPSLFVFFGWASS